MGDAFVRFRYHFWVEFIGQFSIAKGCAEWNPLSGGVEQHGTPLPLPIPAPLCCPFLPEQGGKIGLSLWQFGGSGFLLPVFGVKPVLLGNQGLIFRLQLGNGG